MDIAGKIIGFLASLMALSAVLLFAYTARSWINAQIVKALRDELAYLKARLEESDKLTTALREKEREHEKKIAVLDGRYLNMEALERGRRAYIFTLERDARISSRHIKRLEKICTETGNPIPEMDQE